MQQKFILFPMKIKFFFKHNNEESEDEVTDIYWVSHSEFYNRIDKCRDKFQMLMNNPICVEDEFVMKQLKRYLKKLEDTEKLRRLFPLFIVIEGFAEDLQKVI